jgi:hypothetical protein
MSHFVFFPLFFLLTSVFSYIKMSLASPLSSFNKAADSQSVEEGGGSRFFTLASKFFYKLSTISIKEDGCRFPSDIRGFSPIRLVGIFLFAVYDVKKHAVSMEEGWSNHTAQIFLTRPSVSSFVRHGCNRQERFPCEWGHLSEQ